MRLLVVTPTLGRSDYLLETVESVARCRADCGEIMHVVVAPVSVQAALMASLAGQSVTIVAETDRVGMYSAINSAVAAVKDDWDFFTYINDDDRLAAGFSELLKSARSAASPSPALWFGRVDVIDGQGRRLFWYPFRGVRIMYRTLLAQGVSPFYQQGFIASRSCYALLGGFDVRYRLAGDHDFWVRAVLAGVSIRIRPWHTGSFRLRPEQLSAAMGTFLSELRNCSRPLLQGGGGLRRLCTNLLRRLLNADLILRRVAVTGALRSSKMFG